MRQITVNEKQYSWDVGKQNIVIKGDGYKKLVSKESLTKKYFVVFHDWDAPTMYSAVQFASKAEAQKRLKICRSLDGAMSESYMFSSTRFGAVTPAVIKKIILESL